MWINAGMALVGGTLFFVLPTGTIYLSHIPISARRPTYNHPLSIHAKINVNKNKRAAALAQYADKPRAILAGVYWGFEHMMLESIPALLLQRGMGSRALWLVRARGKIPEKLMSS